MRALALLSLLFASTTAFADRRELVLQLEAGAGIHLLQDAATAQSPAAGVGLELQVHAFYGLSNSLHVGGYGRGFYAPDIAFQNVTPTFPDGSKPTGALYQNVFGGGAGALGRWRFDTGYAFAPFVQLELGAAFARADKLQLIPTGKTFGLAVPSRDVWTPEGRLLVGLEYRFGEHLLLSLHLGARKLLNPYFSWQFDGGLAGGVVF